MSSALVIKNKLDGNDYRISIIPVHKRASVPNPMASFFPGGAYSESTGESVLEPPTRFDNIIFEAAIFPKKKFFKPLFSIELDDGYSKKITEEEFTKFIHHIIANEKIVDLMNGDLDVYSKYGFMATGHDMWQLFFLGKMRLVFIFKDPYKN